MAAQKVTNLTFFKMHTDMIVVTIQSSKIVSNKVRQLSAAKALLWRKK